MEDAFDLLPRLGFSAAATGSALEVFFVEACLVDFVGGGCGLDFVDVAVLRLRFRWSGCVEEDPRRLSSWPGDMSRLVASVEGEGTG